MLTQKLKQHELLFFIGPVTKVFPVSNITWKWRNNQGLKQSQNHRFLEES